MALISLQNDSLLPDWTDQNAYPQKLSGQRWAWEFVRRNPRYRSLWNRYVRPFVNEDGKYDRRKAMDKRVERRRGVDVRNYYFEEGTDFVVCSGEDPPSGQEIPVVRIKDWQDPKIIIAKRYRLKHALDPGHPGVEEIIEPIRVEEILRQKIIHSPEGLLPQKDWYDELFHACRENEMYPVIRLDQPIDPQLSQIRSRATTLAAKYAKAKKLRPPPERFQVSKFPIYLRTLDAVERNVPWAEIARNFCPNEENSIDNNYRVSKRIENYYKAACRFRDVDYRYLSILD